MDRRAGAFLAARSLLNRPRSIRCRNDVSAGSQQGHDGKAKGASGPSNLGNPLRVT